MPVVQTSMLWASMVLDLLKLLRGLGYLLFPCSLSQYPRSDVEVTRDEPCLNAARVHW